ncbi:beta-1,3-galactosyltransferase 1-like [Lineus longissimus]|uniref:beta-1,3-galactosyltransferase 1-like n=1 Tax=Lineus longissimus TaxID=88925 RepID=UPI00315C4C7D
MMDTWSLIRLRYKRSGVHLSPIGWIIVAFVVSLILYKFYNMSERRANTGKVFPAPVLNEIDVEAIEKKYKDEMQKNIKEAGKDMPKLPIFDRDFEEKVHLEHIPKPNVKKFPVNLVVRPKVDCKELLLVILVSSDMDGYQARNAIRQTWGTQDNYKKFKGKQKMWQTVFVMGRSNDRNDDLIRDENERNGDIIQADFMESKQEETRKFMVGVTWIVQKLSPCKPTFLLKVPDHEYINMPSMLAWITSKYKTAPRNIYLGKMIRLDQPIRDETNPLYVSRKDYPQKFFPDLIEGPVYFFSFDVIQKMRPLFGVQIPIAMEDGYIGIMMKRLGIRPRNNERFHKMNFVDQACQHLYMILVHNLKPLEQLTLFDNINRDSASGECKQAKLKRETYVGL